MHAGLMHRVLKMEMWRAGVPLNVVFPDCFCQILCGWAFETFLI